ncbi:MAG: helix-turn-helix domain-containing protein [Dehalococcoidia bacterium]|nr:helix-turn-helix domain-containing protein [Dehalococcoidia bacterium]
MEKLMTVDEVAEYLRLNRETIVRKARKGELPSIKVGYRTYRFHRDQIDEYLKVKAAVGVKEKKLQAERGRKMRLVTFAGGGIIGGLSRKEIYEGR